MQPGTHVLDIAGPAAGELKVTPIESDQIASEVLREPLRHDRIVLPQPIPPDALFVEAMIIAPEITPIPGYFYWSRASLMSHGAILSLDKSDHFMPVGGKAIALAALKNHNQGVGMVLSIIARSGGIRYKCSLIP